jgi:integrase/recombinase XerD
MLKGQTYPPEPLSPAEVEQLIRACSRRYPCGIRNAALFAVMVRGGLRISEALALYPKDVDLEAGIVRILHGKGDKSRIIGLDAGASALVQRWLDHRPRLGLNGRHPLFSTLKGQPLSQVYVRQALGRTARKAGIEKRVHPHGLRHTCAADLARSGVPTNVIQRVLGHTSLATTDVYLRHVSSADVVEVMRAREPLGTWTPAHQPPGWVQPDYPTCDRCARKAVARIGDERLCKHHSEQELKRVS